MIYDIISLFITFFKIGLFTIGGGYAMIPLIEQEVTAKGWISISELTDFIAVSESTPGPFAINLATFIGTKTSGVLGALASTLGVVLPSFLIILVIAKFFIAFKDNKYVVGALTGLRPVIIALVASAVFLLMKTNFIYSDAIINSISSFFTAINIKMIAIFIIVLLIQIKFKLHPIIIILISAALGLLAYGVLPMFGI